jgi:hypothetical protein
VFSQSERIALMKLRATRTRGEVQRPKLPANTPLGSRVIADCVSMP